MIKKNKSSVSIGEGQNCPKCFKPMERREHRNITDKILRQPYYYSEWDICKPCGHIQHYEHKKVFNNNEKTKEFLRKRAELEEYNNRFNLFKNL
jgi:uncharacterized protein with PIN domain